MAVTKNPSLPSGYLRLCWDPRPLLPKDLSVLAGPLCPAGREGRDPKGGRRARAKLPGGAEAGTACLGGLGRAGLTPRGACGVPSLSGLRGRRAHVHAHVQSCETEAQQEAVRRRSWGLGSRVTGRPEDRWSQGQRRAWAQTELVLRDQRGQSWTGHLTTAQTSTSVHST